MICLLGFYLNFFAFSRYLNLLFNFEFVLILYQLGNLRFYFEIMKTKCIENKILLFI